MEPSKLTYNPETATFVDTSGKNWIRNLYVEDSPIYFCIDEPVWQMQTANSDYPGYIDWTKITLPADVISAIKEVLVGILAKVSSSSITKQRLTLEKISSAFSQKAISDEFLSSIPQLSKLWNDWFTSADRSCFREIYKHLASKGAGGASTSIHNHLKSWKARNRVQTLRSVLEWDTNKGALTSNELEVLLQEFAEPVEPQRLSPSDEFARILVRTFISTFRRTSQVLRIPSDGLRRIPTSSGNEVAFLVTPGAKAQINSDSSWEPIPIILANEIESYRSRNEVRAFAEIDPYLLFAVTRTGERSPTTAALVNSFIRSWVEKRKIISPRTGKLMKLNMNRLRHTGATQLAIQGYSRDVIQQVLQHDSPSSAQFYIDSVGSDTTLVFGQIDRKLGGKFSNMKNAFFKGCIISKEETTKPPVVLPSSTKPSLVGACGKSGNCSLHPLLSCYSCSHFLAFKEADHTKVLNYVESEAKVWHSVEYGVSRGKSTKDFDRIAAGVREVIDLISEDTPKHAGKADTK